MVVKQPIWKCVALGASACRVGGLGRSITSGLETVAANANSESIPHMKKKTGQMRIDRKKGPPSLGLSCRGASRCPLCWRGTHRSPASQFSVFSSQFSVRKRSSRCLWCWRPKKNKSGNQNEPTDQTRFSRIIIFMKINSQHNQKKGLIIRCLATIIGSSDIRSRGSMC